jgi:hydroxypyruvate isomerase
MPKFCANLTMLFNEHPFLDRFDAAAKAGFKGVEFLFPYAFAKEDIAERLQKNDLTQVLFNLPAGDWDKGERGIAVTARSRRRVPGRRRQGDRLRQGARLHAGQLPGGHRAGRSRARQGGADAGRQPRFAGAALEAEGHPADRADHTLMTSPAIS